MLEKLGRFAEAEQRLRRSLAIHQRLLDRDPRNALSGGDLAFVHTALGALLLRRGQPAPAREALAKAIDIQDRLRAEDPNNVEYAGNLGRAHALLGQALELVKEPAQACESYRRGREALSGAAGKFAPDVSPELLNRKLAGCERAANR
jgi:tetratricopeptide (TPR) repeat protein